MRFARIRGTVTNCSFAVDFCPRSRCFVGREDAKAIAIFSIFNFFSSEKCADKCITHM